MSKCVLAPRMVFCLLACLAVSPISLLRAQSDPEPGPGGVRQFEAGQPYAMIHPTVDVMKKEHASKGFFGSRSGSKLLSYRGGYTGVGVETAPKVFLVLWGSNWSSDPSGEANLLESFFNGVGGSTWQATVTQYCQGLASGTTNCKGSGKPAGNQPGSFGGVWSDNSTAPTHPTQSQLAAEAVKAASHFGNTTSSSNANAQYVIATAHNNNMNGFGTQWCAWHSSTSSSAGQIAYTNLPYMTDAGASCGANFNNLGATAGITIVEGHEMAETISDPFPNTGWLDNSGEEIGDKCAWISSGQGASANITISSGTFPVQSLWSNAFNSNAGGCVITYP